MIKFLQKVSFQLCRVTEAAAAAVKTFYARSLGLQRLRQETDFFIVCFVSISGFLNSNL